LPVSRPEIASLGADGWLDLRQPADLAPARRLDTKIWKHRHEGVEVERRSES